MAVASLLAAKLQRHEYWLHTNTIFTLNNHFNRLLVVVVLCNLVLQCPWSQLLFWEFSCPQAGDESVKSFPPQAARLPTYFTHNTKHYMLFTACYCTYSMCTVCLYTNGDFALNTLCSFIWFPLLSATGSPWSWAFVHYHELCFSTGWDAGQGGAADAAGTQSWTHGPGVQEHVKQTGNQVWWSMCDDWWTTGIWNSLIV